MFKRVLIIISIFVISVLILIVGVLQSQYLMQPVLKFVLQKSLKGYTVQRLTIGQQKWVFPGEISMSDVRMKLNSKDGDWSIKLGQLRADGIHRLIQTQSPVNFSVQGAYVAGKQVSADGIDLTGDLYLQNHSLVFWHADVKMQKVQALQFAVDNVSAQVDGQGKDVHIYNLNLEKISASNNFSCEGMDWLFDLRLRDYSLYSLSVDFKIQKIRAANYVATNASARIDGAGNTIEIKDIFADFYQGKINALTDFQLTEPVTYGFSAKLTGVDLNEMKDSNKALYDQIQGIMDADIAVNGRGSSLHAVKLSINMTKDAQLRASLLKFVLPYIPPTQDIKAFEELILHDLKVPVERADLNLQSVASQKLSGEIHLGVRKINLNLNLPLDILFDGNLISLIQWYQKLFQ